MTVKIETWARRGIGGEAVKVTEGLFTYVAIDSDRRPVAIPPS
jgi:acyl-CoA thioesterase YciA